MEHFIGALLKIPLEHGSRILTISSEHKLRTTISKNTQLKNSHVLICYIISSRSLSKLVDALHPKSITVVADNPLQCVLKRRMEPLDSINSFATPQHLKPYSHTEYYGFQQSNNITIIGEAYYRLEDKINLVYALGNLNDDATILPSYLIALLINSEFCFAKLYSNMHIHVYTTDKLRKEIAYFKTSSRSNSSYSISTTISYDNKSTEPYVEKLANTKKSLAHIENITENYKALKSHMKSGHIRLDPIITSTNDTTKLKYIHGKNVYSSFFDFLLSKNDLGFMSLFTVFTERLKRSFGSNTLFLDANFDNFILDEEDQLWIIDYEWLLAYNTDLNTLVTRSLLYFFQSCQPLILNVYSEKQSIRISDNIIIPAKFYSKLKNYLSPASLFSFLEHERIFQNSIGNKTKSEINPLLEPRVLMVPKYHTLIDTNFALKKRNDDLISTVAQNEKEIKRLNKEMLLIKESNYWKLAQFIHSTYPFK